MAVQARHISHDFPAAVGGGSLFLDEYAPTTAPARPRDTTVLRDFPRSDLACNYGGFVPRKRPRLAVVEAPAPGCFLDDQRALMTPVGIEGLVAAPTDSGVVDAQSRVVGSGAASTSGRVANGASATRGLLSWMHRQGAVEIDALVRLEVRACNLHLRLIGN
jgi:E3 ubiquitin-protein ligase BOI-like protein